MLRRVKNWIRKIAGFTTVDNSILRGDGSKAAQPSLAWIDDDGNLTADGVARLKERGAAIADEAAYGQVWVKNATPNELWFTDDAGTDFQLGVGGGAVAASDVTVAVVGTPTYTNVQHAINFVASTGRISGGAATDAGGETIDIAAGTGWVKATDSDVAEIMLFDWAAVSGVAIPTDTTRYVQVAYNAGTPVASVVTSESWDLDTSFPLAIIINEGGTLHILNNPWWTADGITNVIERLQAEGNIVRDAYVGGLILSVTGTRCVAVTAGTLWSRLTEYAIPAIDTNVAGTVETYYRSAASTWTDADVTLYPITQYNRLSDNTLQTIPNNQYFNWWVYAEADDKEISLVYPQATYVNAALAEAEAPPTAIPVHIGTNAILIGRILCKEGVDAPVEVQSAFSTVFTASAAADHGNLAGLADDDHPQYLPVAGGRDMTGLLTVTKIPTGNTAATASVAINPASATANADLLWLGVNGSETFTVDEDGDVFGNNIEADGYIQAYGGVRLTKSGGKAQVYNKVGNDGFFIFGFTLPQGRVTVGEGGGNEVSLGENLSQNSFLIRRDVDGASTYSEAGALLKLERDITNATSEDGNYIECDAVFKVDKIGGVTQSTTVYTPSSDQARADDSTITVANTIVRVVGDGGAALLDTDPAIADGAADGQYLIIQGTHDTNTVEIANAVNTQLAGSASMVLGKGDTLTLIWDAGESLWLETSRSAN